MVSKHDSSTGAVIDTGTGLYYMNARYYDPATGRFISQDSYRGDAEVFWHLYAYCDGDPVNCTDPTGHKYGAVLYDGTYFTRQSYSERLYLKNKFISLACVYRYNISNAKNFKNVWNALTSSYVAVSLIFMEDRMLFRVVMEGIITLLRIDQCIKLGNIQNKMAMVLQRMI